MSFSNQRMLRDAEGNIIPQVYNATTDTYTPLTPEHFQYNESVRISNENIRQTNEQNRIDNESTRQSNEQTRQNQYTQMVDATNGANAQAQYAETQGGYAKQVADNTKTTWLEPVDTFADISMAYLTPTHGDTVMVTDTSKIYRYQNGQWSYTQLITDNGFTDHLADNTPHLIQNEDDGKTYKYGFRFKDGGMQLIFEEVL